MRLHSNWKRIVKRAWSFRLAAFGAALALADTVLPELDGLIPKWAYLALFIGVKGARLLKQGGIDGEPQE